MKGYCKNCNKVVDALAGYYYWKCPKCYNPVKLSFINKIKDNIWGIKNV